MPILNIGILAHVDAGKTSLTEQLLFRTGVIAEVGSVDAGSTRTDSMDLERRRGITIRSAVVSFPIDDLKVNLIDTPGHSDFIAEVERALGVLDGAVLVVSAVEGVQAQTRVLMRTLQQLRIPVLIFVNKIDRAGARDDGLLRDIADKLAPHAIALNRVDNLGSRDAQVAEHDNLPQQLAELLAEHDDRILQSYVEDKEVLSSKDLRRELATQVARAAVYPVFFGSAITGVGVETLIRGIRELLPPYAGPAEAPLSGTVFKIERNAAGHKIAYVRMFAGVLKVRDRVTLHRGDQALHEERVTVIRAFEHGSVTTVDQVYAGEIATVQGLSNVRIGDVLGIPQARDGATFARPTLETVVEPVNGADRSDLHMALQILAEQDPLINIRTNDVRREISVFLYGEVQKEVIQATLGEEYGVDVRFRESQTVCVERPVGSGAAMEEIGGPGNLFVATVGLRVEPGPVGSGVRYTLEVELGCLPLAFHRAIEDAVRSTLREGLCGWEVTDCAIFLTHAGFAPPVSAAGDFRNLTPLVLMDALRHAGTAVCEPMSAFHLQIPSATLGSVSARLGRAEGMVRETNSRAGTYELGGVIPARTVHDFERQVPTLTSGEGVFVSRFDSYRAVSGTAPTRARSDHNPLDRKEYLLHVLNRV